VFDAIGSLTYVDDTAVVHTRIPEPERAPSTAPAPTSPEENQATRSLLGPSTTFRISPVPPATLAGNHPARGDPLKAPQDEPAVVRRRAKANTVGGAHEKDWREQRSSTAGPVPTLAVPDNNPVQEAEEAATAEAVEQPAESEKAAPAMPAAEAETIEGPPSFARPKRQTPRGFSVVYGGGTALLLLFAAIQLAVIFRGSLMIHWPQSRLVLVELCAAFGCTVTWPTQADQLAVLGTELQAIPGTDVLELSAMVRNRADFRQSLPALEVTLTDARNRPVARKVFTPADYLASAGEPTARLHEGLAPGSDLAVRIFFEARGLAPAGFLVYPFYL
jgi:hypothetical protein